MLKSLLLSPEPEIWEVSYFSVLILSLIEPEEIALRMMVPGPGHYKAIGLDAEGKYAVSTIP
jgi:hypothetical protein